MNDGGQLAVLLKMYARTGTEDQICTQFPAVPDAPGKQVILGFAKRMLTPAIQERP